MAVCVVCGLVLSLLPRLLALLLAGFALAPYFDLLAPLLSGPLNSGILAWLGLLACLLLSSPSFFSSLFLTLFFSYLDFEHFLASCLGGGADGGGGVAGLGIVVGCCR